MHAYVNEHPAQPKDPGRLPQHGRIPRHVGMTIRALGVITALLTCRFTAIRAGRWWRAGARGTLKLVGLRTRSEVSRGTCPMESGPPASRYLGSMVVTSMTWALLMISHGSRLL